MVVRFTAYAVSALDLGDLNTFLIALADDAEEPTCTLELQKALEEDVDDPDSDTYCLVVDGAATSYGSINRCHLKDDLLVLQLNEHAAMTLNTSGFEVTLAVDDGGRSMLRESLRRLFMGDRCAPADLVLM